MTTKAVSVEKEPPVVYVDRATWAEVEASYSGDRISEGQPLRRPFLLEGKYYISTGGPPTEHGACQLVPREEFIGEVCTYLVPEGRESDEYYEERRQNPMGFYHGMLVKRGKRDYVLVGPKLTIKLAPEPPAQEEVSSVSAVGDVGKVSAVGVLDAGGVAGQVGKVSGVETGVSHIDLGAIRPNPWQAERPEDPQALQELAQSILVHGLIETPLARPAGDQVELATGHRRLAAHRLLVEQGHGEFSRMRLRLQELSDSQMADIVLQENKRRQDLNPIAEARLYRRYLEEFKVTQAELAERVGCSQGEIANTLRLLGLPDEAQKLIISREISASHGRELLRLSRWPQVQALVVQELAKSPVPVEALGKQIDSSIRGKGKGLGENHYPRPVFDVAGCQGCPDRVMANHWGGEKAPYCMNPGCWDKKQAEAQAAQEKEVRKKLLEAGAGAVHDKLAYGSYEWLESYNLSQLDKPEECEECPRRHYMKDYAGEMKPVCVDLQCFRNKKARKTKADNERDREEARKVTERIDAALAAADPAGRPCSLLVLEVLLRLGWSEVRGWFTKAYDMAEKPVSLDSLPAALKGKMDKELRAMVPRVAMEVLRTNFGQRPDRLNHHLGALEGAPREVALRLVDGQTQSWPLGQIREVQELRFAGASRYFAVFQTETSVGSLPITKESAEELVRTGVKKEWQYGRG